MSILVTVLSSSLVSAAGFMSGNQFTSVRLSGDVTVLCNFSGRFDSRFISCVDETLDPTEFDYFSMDESIPATKVILKSKETGRTKESPYLTEKRRSKKYFNLWVSTLFQRPLLSFGENHISYQLNDGSKIVRSGEFMVKVSRGRDRLCRHRVMQAGSPDDCNFGSPTICSEYFSIENYCQ